MKLSGHLDAGYQHAGHGGSDPAPACAADIPRPEIEAEIARLTPFVKQDHVSRVWIAFMRRVLDLPPETA